jgi:hypothetical protein
MSLYDDAYEQTSYSYPWMHHTSASSLKRRIRSMTFLSLLPCVYYVCVRERERKRNGKSDNVYCVERARTKYKHINIAMRVWCTS